MTVITFPIPEVRETEARACEFQMVIQLARSATRAGNDPYAPLEGVCAATATFIKSFCKTEDDALELCELIADRLKERVSSPGRNFTEEEKGTVCRWIAKHGHVASIPGFRSVTSA